MWYRISLSKHPGQVPAELVHLQYKPLSYFQSSAIGGSISDSLDIYPLYNTSSVATGYKNKVRLYNTTIYEIYCLSASMTREMISHACLPISMPGYPNCVTFDKPDIQCWIKSENPCNTRANKSNRREWKKRPYVLTLKDSPSENSIESRRSSTSAEIYRRRHPAISGICNQCDWYASTCLRTSWLECLNLSWNILTGMSRLVLRCLDRDVSTCPENVLTGMPRLVLRCLDWDASTCPEMSWQRPSHTDRFRRSLIL